MNAPAVSAPVTATAALFFNPIDPDLLCFPAPRVMSCECRKNRSASHKMSRAAVDFGSLGYLFVTESDGNNARHGSVRRKALTYPPLCDCGRWSDCASPDP